VAITFDDAYRNVLNVAGPILRRFAFPSTVFVPTDWRGRVNGWIEPTPCDLEIMNNPELREAGSQGLVLESHGHAHIDMSSATPEEVERDIKISVEEIEAVCGRRPRFLAYPYGRRAEWTPAVVAGSGLAAAFTIDEAHQGRFEFGRVQVTPLDSTRTFALKTSGRYLSLRHSRIARFVYGGVKPVVRRALQRGRS
jgi:peptidoglycan/xylan/chitin deacetylase (PgdA/CDA1 family)